MWLSLSAEATRTVPPVRKAEGPAAPLDLSPFNPTSGTLVVLGPVCYISLDRAARRVGPQDPQRVVTGSDGLFGHGSGLVLLRLPRIRVLVVPDRMGGMRLRSQRIGGVHLLAPPPPPRRRLSPLQCEEPPPTHREQQRTVPPRIGPDAPEEAASPVLQPLSGEK